MDNRDPLDGGMPDFDPVTNPAPGFSRSDLDPLPLDGSAEKNTSTSFSFGSLFNSFSFGNLTSSFSKAKNPNANPSSTTTKKKRARRDDDDDEAYEDARLVDEHDCHDPDSLNKRLRTEDRRIRKSVHDRSRRANINTLFGRLKELLGMPRGEKDSGRRGILKEAVDRLEAEEKHARECEEAAADSSADATTPNTNE